MAIYAISDLHLSFSVNKPMNIFGSNWDNYTDTLCKNWHKLITDDDIVLMPGDTSWGTYLDEALSDFEFIDKLPGKKIITKGNHDYWWETVTKMNKFCAQHNISSITFLHNSVYVYENVAICGTKGYPDNLKRSDDEKLFRRELSRLRLSLESAKKQNTDKIIVLLHYPPDIHSEFADIMHEFNTDICIYGHLHDRSIHNAVTGMHGNIQYNLVSCDYLGFTPMIINV